MPLRVKCSRCQAVLQVLDETQGKKVRCPKCKAILQVPVMPAASKLQPSLPLSQEAKGSGGSVGASSSDSPPPALPPVADVQVKDAVGNGRTETSHLERGEDGNGRSGGQSPEIAVAPSEDDRSSGVDAQNPWPGLAPFTEELKDFFHGRAEEADELLRRVGRKDLTVLFGQSGLGKSSLLQAGLFPRLRQEGYLPVPIRLDHAATAPPLPEQVKTAVTRAILESGGRAENAAAVAGDTLWEYFHRRGMRLQTPEGEPVRLVLVLDQFEELFAIGQASEETRARAAHFLSELADLIENRVPKALEERLEESPALTRQFSLDDRGYRALICLREDYLPHLESLRSSMPSIAENRMRLTRMNGLRALEAVLEPGGGLIAPEVGRQIVRFVAGGRLWEAALANGESEDEELARLEVEPSLLSLVCRELNNRRLVLELKQITADLLAGNRERILQDYYERCFADQPAAVREFVEDELVTDSGLRENIALERARKTLTQRGAPAAAIDELVKRRLLHIEERLDIQRVELTHDVLTAVVKKSRDQRQQQEATLRAEQQAREARAKARRQRRRLRWIVAGMAVALLVVSGFGAASYYQYRISYQRLLEAKRARAEALREKERAEREKERAEENQKLADRSFDEARETVDELLTEMSQEGLKDVPGLQKLRQNFAQKAVNRYEVYRTRRPDDPGVTDGYARSLTALGTIIGQVGSVEKAIAALEKAIRISGELVARDPANLEHRLQRARSRVELGNLYRSLNRQQEAQPHLKRAIAELEPLSSQKTNLTCRIWLVWAYVDLGRSTRDGVTNTEAKGYYERARLIAQELYDQHPDDPECLRCLSVSIGNLAEMSKEDGDYAKALALEDKFLELTDEFLKRFPRSPNMLNNRGIGYEDKADLLMKLKRPDEAIKCIRNALASYRAAAKDNPLVSSYQWSMADGLRNLARHLSSRNQFDEAKALYEESCEILEALTQGADDRPKYGTALIESWLALAEFHQGGKGGKVDEMTRKREWLRCLEQALQHGRDLSKKYPNDPRLHYQIAVAFCQRAAYESVDKEAYPFYEKGDETFRTRVFSGDYKPTEYQTGQFLVWTDLAQQCAQNLKRGDEVTRLANVAYDLGRGCTSREGISSLGNIIGRSAKVHKEAGRHKEAAETYGRAVQVHKPAFEKAPWHWYLRSNLSIEYKGLAESYEKLADFRNEVLAWREYLKVWSGPMDGMKIDEFLAPNRPTTEAEAKRLRQFVKSAPGMKRFTIRADFNGLTYPFHVYVTNVPWPKDPLEDQARWLSEERGGTVPEEIRESFRKLHKIAYENNVSFIDLCVFALSANSVSDAKKEELNKAKKKALGDVVALTGQLRKEPANVATQVAAGRAYEQLAAARKELGEMKEAIQACEQARRLYEAVHRQRPDAEGLEHLARIDFTLGELYRHYSVKEYTHAYTAYQRSLDFLDELSSRRGAKLDWRKESLSRFKALGYLCKEAFTSTEAARWYLKAMEQADSEAAKGLASLYLEHPEVAAAVPEPTRKLLAEAAEKTKKDPKTFPTSFAQAVQKIQAAQLRESAERFHDLAEVYAAKGRKDDYRKALTKEFDTLGRQVKLDPANRPLKDAQVSIAVKLAGSYLESKETKAAVEWTTRAAELNHVESLLQLADWYEKGTFVKADIKKAKHYSYLGHYMRGYNLFAERRYKEALPDLQLACNSEEGDAMDHDKLGMCYGKLGRWDEAIKAYSRSIELDLKSSAATGNLFNLLEALVVAERPEQLLQLIQTVEKKGWKLPKVGAEATKYNALYHAFRAIALHMSGKDASDAERQMRQITGRPGFKITGWTWDELDQWLKTTKLAADRKAAVQRIIAELKGTKGQPPR